MSEKVHEREYRPLLGSESDTVLTGEGVYIDVPAVSLAARGVATFIDLLLQYVALAACILALGWVAPNLSDAQIVTVMLLVVVGVMVGYPVTMETLTHGRTLGKMALKQRVVRDDGGPIGFRQALVRGLTRIIEINMLSGAPAVISAIFSTKGKRLGDYAAGTYVIREETAIRLAPPPQMPPPLAAWASSADIAALPDGLALQIRQFLCRAQEFTPQARHRMALELLRAVLPRVAPAPPDAAPAEMVLAAVLAERRRRDSDRLARDHQRRAALLRG